MKIIFLAGGGGTRLWPMSRQKSPKQFQELIGEKSMIQQTLDRFRGSFPGDDFYVSVSSAFLKLVKKHLPDIPDSHYIIEPQKRDTGPAYGFAAAMLMRICPDEPIAFIPTDHLIKEVPIFLRSLRVAERMIRSTGKMMDIGVVPTYPNVNLGYTHIGKKVGEDDGVAIHEFLGHKEKPPLEVAQTYLKDGSYLWHASYYMWTPRKFLEAYAEIAPQIYEHLAKIQDAIGTPGEQEVIAAEYPKMEKISIDYAVTEQMNPRDVLIIPASFYWSDVGAWRVIKKELEENPQDNVTRGEHVSVDTKDCLIYGQPKKLIATVGLENMVVVDTPDALLICPKDRDQDVKKIVEQLLERGENDYL
ncbi:MAG: sugar phosphate nucleotidyltransferase [Patescibacteria group bacterium]